MMIAVPIELALGLLIALWINREFVGRRLVLTILMIPTMIAPVVVGMIWRFFLMPSFGVLTVYMNRLGLFEETSVFSGPITAFGALIIIDIWEWTPFIMLIMLAGLSALPQAPIEAATIDGASRWQIFRHIQLPMLFPLIVVAVMLRGIDASKVFDTTLRAHGRWAGQRDRGHLDLRLPNQLHTLGPGLRCRRLPCPRVRLPGGGRALLQDRERQAQALEETP